jgi:hypothetical protein
MTLTNSTRLAIQIELARTVGLSPVTAAYRETVVPDFGDGEAMFTAAAETPADPYATVYDLADESLDDPLGAAVAFETVNLLYFKNDSEHALTLGGGADDLAILADGLTVPAGGTVLLVGAFAVAASADQITITGTAAADAFELAVIGAAPEA